MLCECVGRTCGGILEDNALLGQEIADAICLSIVLCLLCLGTCGNQCLDFGAKLLGNIGSSILLCISLLLLLCRLKEIERKDAPTASATKETSTGKLSYEQRKEQEKLLRKLRKAVETIESELADILWQYGEERASRAIARRIVQERAKTPITTTTGTPAPTPTGIVTPGWPSTTTSTAVQPCTLPSSNTLMGLDMDT